MNPCTNHLHRLEFVVTLACTGHCKHCSEGDHPAGGVHLDGAVAARAVRHLAREYRLESVMTFGGEPLLYPETVCAIHAAAREQGIPHRQLITNGFFTREESKIRETAAMLAESGVNELLLSADAFHQETIPLEPVKCFARAVQETGVALRIHPAWLVHPKDPNPYNRRTREILGEFAALGVEASDGNLIFPGGNARKYLADYFQEGEAPENPYEEDPRDLRAICVNPDGTVLGGSLSDRDILDILDAYRPV